MRAKKRTPDLFLLLAFLVGLGVIVTMKAQAWVGEQGSNNAVNDIPTHQNTIEMPYIKG